MIFYSLHFHFNWICWRPYRYILTIVRNGHLLFIFVFFSDINEVKTAYSLKSPRGSMTNGHMSEDPMSKGLRAAAVHGQLMQEDTMVRKPTRLDALPSVNTKKGKKKKNALDPLWWRPIPCDNLEIRGFRCNQHYIIEILTLQTFIFLSWFKWK